MPLFERTARVPGTPEDVFDWHAAPGAFDRLLPPWEDVVVEHRTGGITHGGVASLRVRRYGIPFRWDAIHEELPLPSGRGFQDHAEGGPFRRWVHSHRFLPLGGHTLIQEEIDYELPLGPLGGFFAGASIERDLDRLFRYRHAVTRSDLARHAEYQSEPRRKVAIVGGHDLLRERLVPFLATGGHAVEAIDPDALTDWEHAEPGTFDAVVMAPDDEMGALGLPPKKYAAAQPTVNPSGLPAALATASTVIALTSMAGGARPGWSGQTQATDASHVRLVHGPVIHGRRLVDETDLTTWRQALGHDGRADGVAIPAIGVEDLVGLVHTLIMVPLARGRFDVVATPPEAIRDDRLRSLLNAAAHGPERLAKGIIASSRSAPRHADPVWVLGVDAGGGDEMATYRFVHPTVEDALLHECGAEDLRTGKDYDAQELAPV